MKSLEDEEAQRLGIVGVCNYMNMGREEANMTDLVAKGSPILLALPHR